MTKPLFALALALVACGDDQSAPVDEPGERPRITLTAPTDLDVGAPLVIAWTATGIGEADRVELTLRGPGAAARASSAGYLSTGSAPARVFEGYIGADGSLAMAPGAVAAHGGATIALPSLREGDWTVDAVVLQGERIVAATSATTWVATGGLRLELARTWAEPEDVVSAAIRVRGSSEPLRLSAWLTAPDGTIYTLPSLGDQYVPVAEGPLAAESIPILDEPLGKYGSGRYLVTARLETLDGQERGTAGAVLQVCDEPGTIRGTITGPVGEGSVTAFAIADRDSVSGIVDGSGAFSLSVPAGTWLVGGMDGGTVATVGCGGVTDVTFEGVAAANRPALWALHAPATSRRNLRVVVTQGVSASNFTEDADLITNNLAANVYRHPLAAGMAVYEASDLAAGLKGVRLNQILGNDEGTNLDVFSKVPDIAVIVTLQTKGGSRGRMTVTVVATASETLITSVARDFSDSEELIPQIDDVVATVLAGGADYWWRFVDTSLNPRLLAFWFNNTVSAGSTARGLVHVTDPETGRGLPGLAVKVFFEASPFVGAPTRTEVEGVTNADGVLEVPFDVPSENPPTVTMVAEHVRRSGAKTRSAAAVLIPQEGTGSIRLERSVLAIGGDRTVVTVRSNTAAGRRGIARGFALELEGPPEVAFDTGGGARFEVRTTSTGGPARATVDVAAMNLFGGERLSFTARGYVIQPVSIVAFAEPTATIINDSVAEVRGTVLRQGEPLAIPIAVTLEGSGELLPATTANIASDGTGQFRFLFKAPSAGTGSTIVKMTVVKDASIIETQVPIAYGPACGTCPVVIIGPENIPRGGTELYVANQPVTWSASRGSITGNGVFTGVNLGGTTIITATSVADPTKSARISVVEECTFEEVVPDRIPFTGTVTASVANAPFSQTCLDIHLEFDTTSDEFAFVHRHGFVGCSPIELTHGVGFDGVTVSLAGCTVQTSEVSLCGTAARFALRPDPNTTGLDKRAYSVLQAETGSSTPPCVPAFEAQGVLTRN